MHVEHAMAIVTSIQHPLLIQVNSNESHHDQIKCKAAWRFGKIEANRLVGYLHETLIPIDHWLNASFSPVILMSIKGFQLLFFPFE